MTTNLHLKDLADIGCGVVVTCLTSAGLTQHAAEMRAELFATAAERLLERGWTGDAPALARFVPGRIEVLGKHTDYAGGRSLLAAVERGFCVVAISREDATVCISSEGADGIAMFEIGPDLQPSMGHWSNYPMTVARRIARNFHGRLQGAEMAIASDLPLASGMSSSSALMVACFLTLSDVNDLPDRLEYQSNIHSPEELAGYLGTVENGQTFGTLVGDAGVGTFGGSEDHTAMLCCQGGRLSQYSFCPVVFERNVPVPAGYVFAVGSSGVVAEKTGPAREKYNRASRLAGAVADVWRAETERHDPHMAAAIVSDHDAVGRIRRLLKTSNHEEFSPGELTDRFEQFYAESVEIIPAAGNALANGDVPRFGELVDRSQELTEKQLKNQVDETIFLAASARDIGAAAASAFGAGFGGSVWALVAEDRAEEFVAAWHEAYRQKYPSHQGRAHFFLTQAASSAVAIG
ncbi:MAG: galactokinase family protein [Planctomycetota bacterium]